jgi:hypothetical protein
MDITFSTPALLFPAISLLLLAYTNRFLALANLVRKLHDEYKRGEQNKIILFQIKSLRSRLRMVRWMQGLGVFSFLFCVITMYSIYMNWSRAIEIEFAVSLLSLLISLVISLVEITQSTKALEMELGDIEDPSRFKFLNELWNREKTDDKKNND